MGLETSTYISGLVASNPLSTDPKSQGDDHLRLIKSTILNTFPNITGAVTATQAQLNGALQSGGALGTPVSGNLSNCTNAVAYGLKSASTTVSVSAAVAPASGQVLTASSGTLAAWATPSVDVGAVTGLGTGISAFLATPSSANLAAAVTNETGSGALVFATSPTLVTPALGTPASGVLTNCTGSASGLTAGNALNVNQSSGGTAVSISTANHTSTVGAISVTAGSASSNTVSGASVSITAGTGMTTGNGGNVALTAGGSNQGTAGAVSITAGGGLNTTGGFVNITAGNSSGLASGGDITLTTGTGVTNGKINFVNCNVANGTVATTITSLGPSGAATTIQGWLAVKVGGTDRYIPYW